MIELTKEEAEAIVNYYKSAIYNEDVMEHLLQIDDKDFQHLQAIYSKCRDGINGIIWHKITTRQLTVQEAANIKYPDCYVLDIDNEIVTPEDGEEILIALSDNHIKVVECKWIYDCCLLPPDFRDGDKVNAWARIPKYSEDE